MPRRLSRGCQNTPIRQIEKEDNIYATFSIRRRVLYKKASELSTLCGADVGVTIFPPPNNPFSFWHPTMEFVIGRYRDPNRLQDDQTRIMEAEARGRVEYLNIQLDMILDEKDMVKAKERWVDEVDKTREKGWWEETPIESLNKEQVKEWNAMFQDFASKIQKCIDDKKKGASSSSAAQRHNVAYFPGVVGPSVAPHGFLPGPSYAPAPGASSSSTAQHNNVAYFPGVVGPSAILYDFLLDHHIPTMGMIVPSQFPYYITSLQPQLESTNVL
ncbi:agamous-like mads-box protein agl61 [Phtheirospermum japonicum]|uniref:Agamous-like mads-box protein agl61 n=1 Tax=Phtheirospermum japonicum TaxID=374723 RepID=A0A830CRC0_9LAMI|nr:agamous-like mads-box protein agl61 [Phtheirospermum japonicum]